MDFPRERIPLSAGQEAWDSDVEKAGLVEPFAGPTSFLVVVQDLWLMFDTALSIR